MIKTTRSPISTARTAALTLTLTLSCAEEPTPKLSSVSVEECASGLKWVGGAQGSPMMKPGSDCVGCHRSAPSAPVLLIAGTTYASNSARDDCLGVEGAVVHVEDAGGEVLELTSNRAGNFFLEDDGDTSLELPLKVSVLYEGRELRMGEESFSGSCAECHSGPSASRASARVTVP